MPWYAAHAIMYCQFKDGGQTRTPVWENVLLIQGPDGGTAMRLAGLQLDAAQSAVWVGSSMLLVAGFVALRFAARFIGRRWTEVKAA